jgi:hypothetical protein
MYFLPLVLYVRLQRWQQQCQPYLTTLCGMLLIVTTCYVSMLVCVEYRLSFLFLLGIQLLDIQQHH